MSSSALELSSSEGRGKQTVVDPQMERLNALVETLARGQDRGAGKSEGINTTWGLILTIAGIGVLALTLPYFAPRTPAVSPQVIYAPAPTVAQPTKP